MTVLIQPTTTDVEALARLVHVEAENIATDYTAYYVGLGDSPTVAAQKAMTQAYGTIIDVILNRVAASSSQYGTTIQAVIDKNNGLGVYQFSSLPDHSATTWSELPDVDTSINDFVSAHLAARASGQGSTVGGATHYYNPNISNPVWGPDLERKTGVGLDIDQHLFGTLPDTDPLPDAYTIDFGGDSTTTTTPIPPIPGHKPEFYGPPEPVTATDPYGPWVPGVTVPFGEGENASSPLVLDVDGSGTIELAALNGSGSVMWDIDQDGFLEASAWVTGGDGLLCIDLNSDGVINDHGELFGGTNGYVTLAAYDSNSSGAITSADSQFGSLRVWIDDNADGYSQATELHTLLSLGITSISTAYSTVSYEIAGNEIKYESTFVMNGNTYTSVDAFFAYDPTNTIYAGDYTLDVRTLFLPTVRGYGDLPDLHIAMSMDEDLLDLVQDFSTLDVSEMMNVQYSFDGPIQDIMFRWAGVDGVSPSSRGGLIDARIVEFLEAFVGREYASPSGPDPIGGAIEFLMEAWGNAYQAIATRLIYQASGAHELFTEAPVYDPVTDTFGDVLSVNFATLEDWMDGQDTLTGKLGTARLIVSVIEEVVGIDNLSQQDHDDLQALMPIGVTVEALADPVYGYGAIVGDAQDNLLFGTPDTESLYGYGGNDILVGQASLDGVVGGQGDDTYLFHLGDSIDPYAEGVVEDAAEGTDQIIFGAGIDPDDVRLWTENSGNLFVQYSEDDVLTVLAGVSGEVGAYTTTLVGERLEKIVFDDGTVWDLTGGLHLRNNDTGRTIYGSGYGDTIEGGAGMDALYGHGGNDILIGGADVDSLLGGAGNDSLDGGAGDDYLDGESDTDTVTYASAASAVTVNLATTIAQNTIGAGSDTIANVENLIGSTFNDTLTGNGSANVIEGGAGNDAINGAGGTDTVSYEHAASAVTVNLATTTGQNTGGAGTDTITNTENLRGSAFNDTLTGTTGNNVIEGGAGNDTMNAQGGTDTLTYANAAGAITVSLALTSAQVTGGAGTDTVSNFENLTGSAFGDTLTGSTAANVINGGDGNDVIEGGAGNDTLVGGNGIDTVSFTNAASATTFNLATTSGQNTVSSGTDTVSGFENILGSAFNDTLTGNSSANVIEGGAGNDTMNGSGGIDTVSYSSAASAVTVNLATTTGQNTLGAGTDTLSSFEWLIGSGFNDTLTGSTAANNIYGGAGNDTISGGSGNDILYGGAGTDTLTGGANADTFVFEAASAFANQDTITDFSTANADKIDLHDILDSVFDPVQNAISDFVNFTNSGANSIMSIDQDGAGTTYGFVNVATLNGVTNLDETTLYNNGNLLAA